MFLSNDQNLQEQKINKSELHSLQLNAKHLEYCEVSNLNGVKFFTVPNVHLPRNANTKYLDILSSINFHQPRFLVLFKLLLIAGTDSTLLNLIFNGIATGLSHGTMDIIYRIGVGDKVDEVLDNFEIAIGSLERRIIITDLLSKAINFHQADRIITIAGGSCLLPIEGSFQSNIDNIEIITIDHSTKANKKAKTNMKNSLEIKKKNVVLHSIQKDILIPDSPITASVHKNDRPSIIECTGLWEYLNIEEETNLLSNISKGMQIGDICLLTFLTNNPQMDIFKKIGFKELKTTSVDYFLEIVEPYFSEMLGVVNTPNETYATVILKR